MTIDAEGIEGVGHYRNNRRPPRVVIAPDKFRGTATAGEVAGAIAAAATSLGWDAVPLAMSDGGEGFLDACAPICPHVVVTTVTGPDGAPIDAQWRHGGRMAVVEMARASGLTLAGGPSANDPVEATSRGTGELLIAAARLVGPTGSVVLGLGGSATTDGGRAAWEAVEEAGGLQGTTLMGAYDVDVPFADAAALFGPQKGAGPEQVDVLTQRLRLQADNWRDSRGIDISTIAGGGAAGGMGGAVVMLGGQLRSGYRFVAELVGLTEAMADADRVVTGEGRLDAGSFAGKVVGGVVADARNLGLATLVVAGQTTSDATAEAVGAGCTVLSLTERFGAERALRDTLVCAKEAATGWLAGPIG